MDLDRVRLLMIAPSAVLGGMEEILVNLAVTLPEFGVTPEVISLQQGPMVERLAAHGVDINVIQAGRLRDLRRLWTTSRRLNGALHTGRYDVAYSNMPKAHLYAALAAWRHAVPALWCQAAYPDPPHWIDRLATALPSAGIIALSHDAATSQRRINARRLVHVMHPGVDLVRFCVRDDPELRSRYGIPAEATLVSLVGRLQPWKGQREFLQAAALLAASHQNAHFAIVGGAILGWEGDYPQQLEQLTASLGLHDRVTFTGHTNEVQRWMAASDIVVNASQPEPFGLVVVEAMASGCAVVAVAAGGPRDIIEDEGSGLLCSSRDPEKLAQAITRLLDEPVLRAELGRAARSRVERHFSREAMTERFAAIVHGTAPAKWPDGPRKLTLSWCRRQRPAQLAARTPVLGCQLLVGHFQTRLPDVRLSIMRSRSIARSAAWRIAPGRMADRARRYERDLRSRQGITAAAERLVGSRQAFVEAGPFVGLRYHRRRLAEVDAPVAKLLGTYEREVYGVFSEAIDSAITTFIDVGCADGYFAVGILIASPHVQTYAYDIAPSARQLCRTVAELNGVGERLTVGSRFTAATLDGIDTTRMLMLCDVEGAELDLFDEQLVRRLSGARVLIEVHEFKTTGLSAALTRAFHSSHRVEVILQEPRDPGAFPQLAVFSEEARNNTLSEHRPRDLHWLYLVPVAPGERS